MKKSHPYENILYKKPFHDDDFPRMSRHDRAAQFAPYKALNGYEDSIDKITFLEKSKIWENIDYTDRQDSLEY